jgi:2-(3-amino-3-carboxypropyl)histidine synthase
MEDDRVQVDLGIAADIEEAQIITANASASETATDETVPKQPKKRFIGRRAANEAALKNEQGPSGVDSGALQGEFFVGFHLINLAVSD